MIEYSFNEAIEFFEKLPHFVPPKDASGKDMFSLDAELALLDKMDNPQDKLSYIHVAGTNGKGSTTAYIESILLEADINVGSFTSPFLYRYNEMFKIRGKEISEAEFADIFSFVKPLYDELAGEGIYPSEYEILTSMAFEYFLRHNCDIVLLEVSLGGRVDTTNVIPAPLVSVITPISYDHMTILGNTLAEIATEKAGIIKPGTTVVTANQEPEVMQVLEETCRKNLVNIYSKDKTEIISRDLQGQSFKVKVNQKDNILLANPEVVKTYSTSLLGTYQIDNAALAIKAVSILRDALKNKSDAALNALESRITEEAIKSGIANTKWFGRFTLLSDNPPVIIDGGHNRQGAAVLRTSLEEYFLNVKVTFIMGILKDKEVDIILDELMPLANKCYTMAVPNARTMDPEELADMIRKRGVEAEVIKDKSQLKEIISQSEVTCIAGSLYLISSILYQVDTTNRNI